MCPGHYAVFTDEDAIAHIENSFHAVTDYLIMTENFLVQEKGEFLEQSVSEIIAEDRNA